MYGFMGIPRKQADHGAQYRCRLSTSELNRLATNGRTRGPRGGAAYWRQFLMVGVGRRGL